MIRKIRKSAITLILTIAFVAQMLPVMGADQVFDPFNGNKNINIVFLGGSITLSAGFRDHMSDYIKNTYEGLVAGRKITSHNAGIGGTNSLYGLLRLERDVISKNPDMVVIDFAVNDFVDNTSEDKTKDNIEGIVRRLQSLEKPPIIVFVYTAGQNLKNLSTAQHEIAKHYNIAEIDFVKAMNEIGYTIDKSNGSIAKYYIDNVHPNVAGHKIWGDYAIKLISENPKAYFRHPILRSSPYSASNNSGISAKYVSAEDAYKSGMMTFDENSGVEIKNNILTMNGKGDSIKFTFQDNIFAFSGRFRTDGGYANYEISNSSKAVSGQVSFYSELNMEQMILPITNLANGSHELKLTVSNDTPTGSTGNIVSFAGFFIGQSANTYPEKYPANMVINKYEEETAKSTVKKADKYIDFLNGLNIIDTSKDGFDAELELSRADFAQIMCNILRISNNKEELWLSEFFGTDYNNVSVEPATIIESVFEDVPDNSDFSFAVKVCNELGFMNGTSPNTFEPYAKMKSLHFLKVIIKFLGYDVNADLYGGYPNGYLYMGNELDILNGVNFGNDDNLTYKNLARMLYNIQDVELLRINKVSSNGEKDSITNYYKGKGTFLNEVLGIYKVSGQMTKNIVTDLKNGINSGTITVSGTNCYLTEELTNYNKFIGRDVTAYYLDDDKKTIVYMALTERDEVIEINADFFVSYNNHILAYEEGNKRYEARLANSASVIYNGVAVDSYDESTFDFENGFINLIKSRSSSDYDVAVVYDYADWYVGGVDTKAKKITRKSTGEAYNETADVINLDELKFVSLSDVENKPISLAEIKTGDILSVARNGNVADIICSKKQIVDFEIKTYQPSPDFIISNNEREYKLTMAYSNSSETPIIKLGNKYNLYLNYFGKVVWLESLNSATIKVGVLFKSQLATVGISKPITVKILSEAGIVETLNFESKVRVLTHIGRRYILTDSQVLYAAMGGYSGLVRYSVNQAGKIDYLEFPLSDRNLHTESGNIYTTESLYTKTASIFMYKKWIGCFSNTDIRLFYKDKITTYFYMPSGEDAEDYYSVSKNPDDFMINDSSYEMQIYSTDDETAMADYVIIGGDNSTTELAYTNMFVVDTVLTAIVNDEAVDVIRGYKIRGTTVTNAVLYSRLGDTTTVSGESTSYFSSCPDWLKSKDASNQERRYKLAKGDVIACEMKSMQSGFVDKVYVVFKADMLSPYESGSENLGWLAGTTSIFDPTKNYGNPYLISGDAVSSGAKSGTAYGNRVIMGYVVHSFGDVASFTTQNLTIGEYNISAAGYMTEYAKIQTSNAFTVNYEGKNVTVKKADAGDIKPYSNYRKDASRLMVITAGSDYRLYLLLNGDLD